MGQVRPLMARPLPTNGPTPEEPVFDSRPTRVLLAVGAGGNRARLRDHLSRDYEVVEADRQPPDDWRFDLAIIDSAGYRHWHLPLFDAKQRESPAFLPVIMMLSRIELKQRLHPYWDLVDEFIVTPIDRLEFSERLSLLVRARHLAQTQQARLAYLTTHDRATGLPNKAQFLERLAERIVDAAIVNQTLQVVVVRFDMRRLMNSLGHHGLDRAAVLCASRLRAASGPSSLARLTTDCWGLIAPPDSTLESLLELCARLAEVAEEPLAIDDERIHLNLTIGVGRYPDDASSAMGLLDCAINALSSARDNRPQFYSRPLQQAALRFLRTETRLREALAEEQFEVWYQPQVRLRDHRTIQVEALVRWRLPNGSLVSPGDFMAVAEATGLVVDIDRWVLRRACDDLRRWRQQGWPIERVAVNMTAEDVQQADFVERIQAELERAGLPASALELELTESTLMEAGEDNLSKLTTLRRLGLDIAIDDFGTGYSSLSYLHRLPISILKIDQCFIRNVLDVPNDAAITRTIVWLAENFRLHTIAEGIESQAQEDYLRSLKVDTTQGFFYAKPLPEAALGRWLAERAPNALP